MRLTLIILATIWGQIAFAQNMSRETPGQLVGFGIEFGEAFLEQTNQPDIWGKRFGLNSAMRLGGDDDNQMFLEFGWSVLDGDHRSTQEHLLASDAPFVFTTRVSPTGDLTLNTTTDATGSYATANVIVTDEAGNETSISSTTFSPPGGQTTVWAYSPSETGGAYTSLVTDGSGGVASAVGTIFDENGVIVMAEGIGGETRVKTDVHDTVTFHDGSIQLGQLVQMQSGWNFISRGGLVLQSLDRSSVTTQTIEIDDGFEADSPTPDLSILQDADLRTEMAGLSVGAAFSRPFSKVWNVSIGADVGAMQGRSRLSLRELVQLDAQPVHTITGPTDTATHTAHLGRVSLGLSRQLPRGGILSMQLYSDFATGIPYLKRVDVGSVAPDTSGPDTTLTASGETNQQFQVNYGDTQVSGVSIGFVWMF